MTDFKKHTGVANFILLLVTLISGLGGGYYAIKAIGTRDAELEQRIFKDAEERYRTTIHVTDTDEILEELKETRRVEKQNATDAIKSRANRDTLLRRAIDLAERNAVTTYQNKQQTDSILKLWNQYNENQN